MPTMNWDFSQGNCTSRDKLDLQAGELQLSTGGYYKPGDRLRLWKMGGRALFGATGSSAPVKGSALCQFDSGGSDKLLALSGTTLYGATPGVTGIWSSLVTGLSASATDLFACHTNDNWYIADGVDSVRVLSSDGTTRLAGLQPPSDQPTVVKNSGGSGPFHPTINSGNFANPTYAYDGDNTSAASYTIVAGVTSTGTIILSGWGADSSAGRVLNVNVNVTGYSDAAPISLQVPVTANSNLLQMRLLSSYVAGVLYELTIYKSEDGGSTWTTVLAREYVSYTGVIPVTSLYEVWVSNGSALPAFDMTTGVYYATTEYDSVNGLESAPSRLSALVQFTGLAYNAATITKPPTVNSTATHWRLYRTVDGSPDNISQLGLLDNSLIPITTTTYVDTFVTSKDMQSLPLVAQDVITDGGASVYFPRDVPPPILGPLEYFSGSLSGIVAPRSLRWADPNFPESWPEVNVIESFPMPENDQLVSIKSVGDTLLIAAKGLMMTLSAWPTITNGVFNNVTVTPLRGQPGCVGPKAITPFSVFGESLAAWVSPYGVHVTNGQTSRRISDDIDWDALCATANLSTALLHYWPTLNILVMSYDSTGVGYNDRWITFHMNPAHQKQNGMPKWTGPHYGQIACMASGQVANVYRVWSGHTSNGSVYTENHGLVDDSSSYSGSIVPLIVTPGSLIDKDTDRYVEVTRAYLQHTDFGAGQNCSISWTAISDKGSTDWTVQHTVSLSSDDTDYFWVAQSGQRHAMTLTHTGAASGGLSGTNLWVRLTGAVGAVLV